MIKNWLVLLLLIFQTFSLGIGEAAPNIPAKPTSSIYVQDYANVLSPNAKQAIQALGQNLDQKTTAQLAVVTIDSLDGAALEDYSLELFRSWGIGDKTKNNGVLILVAVKDRKSRIEVGYGLEGALPDGLTGRIQDQYMLPYFRNGQYERGILNAYGVIANLVAKEYNVTLASGGKQQVAQAIDEEPQNPLVTLLVALGIFILIIIDNKFLGGTLTRTLMYILILFGRGGGRGGGGFGGGGGGFGGGSGGGGGSSRGW